MSTRRLLVITYHFGADGAVGGLRWTGIAKYLARLGWEVSVLTAVPPQGNHKAGSPYVEPVPRLWTFLDGCRLVRGLFSARSNGSSPNRSGGATVVEAVPTGLLRRLRHEAAAVLAFPDESRGWVFRAALRARTLIRRFRPQVVVSSGPPHSAHLVAGMATIGSGARWFIDMRDPWGGPIKEGWASHARIGTSVFRALSPPLERLAFRAADGVIANTKELAALLAARYPDVRVLHVPNGVDPETLPATAAARHPYPGLSIAHAGTLYAGRDLGPVLRALRVFLERHPEAAHAGSKLRIVGRAEEAHASALSDAVAAAGMQQHVERLGVLPRAQALEVVSRSRLGVVLAQEQDLQIPAKLYELVAMGIATLVVAPPGSAAGMEATRIGAIVRDGNDIEGIADVLERLWQHAGAERSSCPVPITYQAIAPVVDDLFRKTFVEM
jgi:glycosyltransferase involved in cell wall biosynthesis